MFETLYSYLKLAYSVSRVRFWFYLAGPYILGYVLSIDKTSQLFQLTFWLHLFYFTTIANVLLYGVNDLFDQDTDQYNVKKQTHEHQVQTAEEKQLIQILIATLVISLFYVIFQPGWKPALVFVIFLMLSVGYSAKPIRLKARPFLDFSSNILYALPGILAYYHGSHTLPHLPTWLALYFWTGAMHLFSAVPDIDADTKAGVTTSAVFMGFTPSLLLCLLYWSIFSVIVLVTGTFGFWGYLVLIYPLIVILLLVNPDANISRIYWFYPYINTGIGFIATWVAGWDIFLGVFNSS